MATSSTLVDLAALDPAQRLSFALGSPAAFYVTGEDALQLTALNSVTGARVVVAGRFLGLDGVARSFVHELAPTADRVVSSIVRPLGDGWILDLNVLVSSGTVLLGQCWARVQIIRGLAASGIVLGTLASGYITSTQPIAFPRGRVRGSLEGPGVIRSITGTDPAAGVEITETVPTGARWRLLAFNASLLTDATVADRRPVLVADDGAATLFKVDSQAGQAAGATWNYSWIGAAITAAGLSSAVRVSANLPIMLLAGYRLSTSTNAFQAGDNWAAPQMLVEEWLEGA